MDCFSMLSHFYVSVTNGIRQYKDKKYIHIEIYTYKVRFLEKWRFVIYSFTYNLKFRVST